METTPRPQIPLTRYAWLSIAAAIITRHVCRRAMNARGPGRTPGAGGDSLRGVDPGFDRNGRAIRERPVFCALDAD